MKQVNRVAIVGSGAVGGYYGARLVEAKKDVTFLLRSDFDQIKEHRLTMDSVTSDIRLSS